MQSTSSLPASAQSPAQGNQLTPGSVISGQVMEAADETVLIKTTDGGEILAKNQEGIPLAKGSFVSFEVGGVSEGQVALKALFTNTAAGYSTMSSALSQAGITETAQSYNMVRAMMENQMPIDKNSLQAMYRLVTGHPETNAENIVSMKSLGLPMTNENITQFEAYKNLEHRITETVEVVSDSISEAISDLSAGGDPAKALNFAMDVAKLLSEGTQDAQQLQGAGPDGGTMQQLQSAGSDGAAAGQVQNAGPDGGIPGQLQSADTAGQTSGDFLKLVDSLIKEEMEGTDAGQLQNEVKEAGGQTPADPAQLLKEAIAKAETASQKEEAAADHKIVISDQSGDDGKAMEQMKSYLSGRSNAEALSDIAKGLEELLKNPGNGAKLEKALALLQGKEGKELFAKGLSEQWRMDPKLVESKDEVQQFYEKLRAQTGKLSQIAESALGKESNLFEQTTSIRQNVDFMNQLNQTVSYVQLPLRLSEENANGDLYVYTNKKNLANNDGKISAFLHLDMDRLGPVDVYVAMENQKVSTNFYLQSDEMIDFISEHIHILDERLAERGYQMNCKVSRKEDPTPANVMEKILEDRRDGFMIGSKSFDVRA